MVLGMTCASIAAQVATEALRSNNLSREFLGNYQRRCQEILGFDTKVMLRMRKTLDVLSDEKLDDMIGLCTRLGLDKTLQSVKDIDFQGHALLHVLRSQWRLRASETGL